MPGKSRFDRAGLMVLFTSLLFLVGVCTYTVLGFLSSGGGNSFFRGYNGFNDEQKAISAKGWADDILGQMKGAETCSACQSVLVPLKGLASVGDDAFVRVLTEICKMIKPFDADVCEGGIALEGPIMAASLREMELGSRTSQLFCITILGLCDFPEIQEWRLPFPESDEPRERPQPSGRKPLKVVHYSDIHIDPLYLEGSSSKCNKPICCRPYTPEDEPGRSQSPAGPFGDHNCDVPAVLEKSLYEGIKAAVPDAAFAIFTGDMVDHAFWNTSQEYNADIISDAYDSMNKTLGLVYGTAGNHESHPSNAYKLQPNGPTQWLYDLLSKSWSNWIGPGDIADVDRLGAYSTRYPNGNLRIISLNTNLFYGYNFWMYQGHMPIDPAGQIEWLAKELAAAEQAGEHVYIIGHMPLGNYGAFHEQSHYLDLVVRRYSGTIAAMFFGHTHVDQFQISYSNNTGRRSENALVTSFVAPSLTPTSGMPSFRVYDVDPDTFGVMDAATYIADMDDPAFQTTGPVWKKYYSTKEAYGPLVRPPVTEPNAELTAAFWHNLTEAMEADETVFEGYLARKSRGWRDEKCTGECMEREICQLRAARSVDNCAKVQKGIYIKARGEQGEFEQRDDCGASVARTALAGMTEHRGSLAVLHKRFVQARRKG